MDVSHCFPLVCGWWYAILALGTFLLGAITGFITTKVVNINKGKCICNRVTTRDGGHHAFMGDKKLCIAAQNSETLNRVTELMEFLQSKIKIEIEHLKLENQGSKPDFSRVNYILCCAEVTSGRGIILSADNQPDQLGAITTHAENAKAHCAILLRGKQDPEEGQLYDETRLAAMVQTQPRLKDFMDTDTLFSFHSKLNEKQVNALLRWLCNKDYMI